MRPAARAIGMGLAAALAFGWSVASAAERPRPARPAGAAGAPLPSAVEEAYSTRAGTPLRLFGHDLFGQPAPGGAAPAPSGALQDDQVLAVGDELTVTLRGQRSWSRRVAVDEAGRVVLDELRPLAAAGRPLREFRAELEAEVRASLPPSEVFVALTSLRRVSVLVVGEVARPGRVEVGGFGTALDALVAAGGVARGGSLRRLRLVGPAGEEPIDLYGLLERGAAGDRRLRDGDRLIVPTLGATVAVAGEVKRPAVYEIAPDRPGPTVDEALALAGGPVRPGALRLLRLGYAPDGTETATEIAPGSRERLADGDLLLAEPAREARTGAVSVLGHVRRPGPRSLADAPTLADLAAATELGPAPYLPFAAVETSGPGRERVLLPVDLGAVLSGFEDRPLRPDDALLVLGAEDVGFLTSSAVLDLLAGRPTRPAAACAGLDALARRIAADPDGVLAAGPAAKAAASLVPTEMPCPPVFDRHPDLLGLALDHAVLLRRGVPRPGLYPAASEGALAALGRAAGAPNAAAPRLAVTGGRGPRPARPDRARAGDVVDAVAPSFELSGRVRHPGTRPLAQGTTLRGVLGDGRHYLPDAYALLGVIDRFEPRTLTRRLIPFSPRELIGGTADLGLAEGDRVRVLSTEEVRRWLAEEGPPAGADPALVALLRERAVTLHGAVRSPGPYPVAETAALGELIGAAGGFAALADTSEVEVTSSRPGERRGTLAADRRSVDLGAPGAALTEVAWGSAVRVNRLADQRERLTVVVEGEVRRPGEYDLLRGETLSTLLARAGGLTDQAYPAGTVFTRESARRQEAAGFERAALELDRALAQVLMGDKPPPPERVEQVRRLAQSLRSAQAVGRLSVEADPAALARRPGLDILLEPGDRVAVPKRPLTVTVSGEVLAPASLPFLPDKEAADYLREAGGMTRHADAGRAFVLLPDGTARPLRGTGWGHEPVMVLPGSTIIVPRDPAPLDVLALTSGVTGVLGQLAISAASLVLLAGR
jgi:protein involved in polysaccharide export with SLBB domain